MFLIFLREVEAHFNLLNGVRVLGEIQKHAAYTYNCHMVGMGFSKYLQGCNLKDTRIVGNFIMENKVSSKLSKECWRGDLQSFENWAMDKDDQGS